MTPIFFRPDDGDVIEEKWRRLGTGETEDERTEEGRPLRPPLPTPVGPAGSGFGASGGLATPEPGAVPIPRLTPAPGGGAPPPSDPAPHDDKGLACPTPQNDRPRGPNVNADTFEYNMSLIVNPSNPTPKQSPMTPNVVSQAYYLPTQTPDGKTSYDDCKKDGTPISIPGVRRGAMFEFKSANFGWQLYYTDSETYQELYKQIVNQNEGVSAENLGRQIYYCLSGQSLADRASILLQKNFPDSHFLVCH